VAVTDVIRWGRSSSLTPGALLERRSRLRGGSRATGLQTAYDAYPVPVENGQPVLWGWPLGLPQHPTMPSQNDYDNGDQLRKDGREPT
jgi:hypothetical protein